MSILETGKDGYNCNDEFDRRTHAAAKGERSEWGDPGRLLRRDAVEVLDFVTGDYQVVAPILAGLKGYRILDLGCGYGRLAPFLAAFDCFQYLGLDREERRIDYARVVHDTQGPRVRFIEWDILSALTDTKCDIVWTSNALQHFTLPDKLRLVEAMKACRAPGGMCLLREEEIWKRPRVWCEGRYARDDHPRHMIPVPFDELAEAFRPLTFRHLGGNVYQAAEE